MLISIVADILRLMQPPISYLHRAHGSKLKLFGERENLSSFRTVSERHGVAIAGGAEQIKKVIDERWTGATCAEERGWLRIARISCTASERYSFQQWQSYCLAPHFLPVSRSFLPHRTRIHSTFPIKGLVHFASAVRCDFAPRMRAVLARSRTSVDRNAHH